MLLESNDVVPLRALGHNLFPGSKPPVWPSRPPTGLTTQRRAAVPHSDATRMLRCARALAGEAEDAKNQTIDEVGGDR